MNGVGESDPYSHRLLLLSLDRAIPAGRDAGDDTPPSSSSSTAVSQSQLLRAVRPWELELARPARWPAGALSRSPPARASSSPTGSAAHRKGPLIPAKKRCEYPEVRQRALVADSSCRAPDAP